MRKLIFTLILTVNIIATSYSQAPIGALIDGTATQPKFIVFDERLPRSSNAEQMLQANLKLNGDANYTLTQQITDQLKTI